MNEDKYLNDIEKDALVTFVNSKVMFGAVRKVLLAGLYFNGTLIKGEEADPTKNFALALAVASGNGAQVSNEELGAELRAAASGIRSVELGFRKIESIVKAQEPSKEIKKANPAA